MSPPSLHSPAEAPKSPPSVPPPGWIRGSVRLLAILLGAYALIWSVCGTLTRADLKGPQVDYYNLLADGFRHGHLWMDIPVPAEIKALSNPWDPAQRVGLFPPHDVSYNRGHYYLYFGAVPAVVLFLPFRFLTGHALALPLGYLVFALAAFLVTGWLWLRLLRDHFPRAGLLTEVMGLLVLGLAGGQWVLARRISIWEPPIAAGHCFLMIMVAAGYLSVAARRPGVWLSVAGLALGLAVGCRPTLGVAVAGLGWLVWVAAVRRAGKGGGFVRELLRMGLAAGVPLALVGGLVLAYNQARFGSPFEFGLNYQLTAAYERIARHFSPTYLSYNLRLYFLQPPAWGRYFPFVHPFAYHPQPAGYYGYENVYGLFFLCPVMGGGLLLPGFARRMGPHLGQFVIAMVLVAGATLATLLSFNTATSRYEVDFLPWLLWLALIAWAFLEQAAQRGRVGRRLVGFALGATSAVSLLLALGQNAGLDHILETVRPGAFDRLAWAFNLPAWLWERAHPAQTGPVAMRVRFSGHPLGSVEPLIVTGSGFEKDYFFVFYESDTVVRLCFASSGHRDLRSEPIRIVPGQTYRVECEAGSLYPPAGFPGFSAWAPSEVDAVKRWVAVRFEGRTVLEAKQATFEASPGLTRFGRDDQGVYGNRFSGTIEQIVRLGRRRLIAPLVWPGVAHLDVVVPTESWFGFLPLIEFGVSGSAQTVGLGYVDATHVTAVIESWGQGLWSSAPITLSADRHLALQVQAGPFLGLAPTSPLSALSASVAVWDGDVPLVWERLSHPFSAETPVALLHNAVGSSVMQARFSGRLRAVWTTPFVPHWLEGGTGPVDLLIGGRGIRDEPLLEVGSGPDWDSLGLSWLSGGQARLVYDHRGLKFVHSAAFAWDGALPHRVRVVLPGPAAPGGGEAHLIVTVDGRTVWDLPQPGYAVEHPTVAIGTNPATSSVVGAALSATVIGLSNTP